MTPGFSGEEAASGFEFLAERGVGAPAGFRIGSARAGIKTHGDDVALIVGDAGTVSAGLFTTNQVKAAPVLVCAEHLAMGRARAVVVNAGNANCATGARGLRDARAMTRFAATRAQLEPEEVLVCSTGIIGHALPIERIQVALDDLTWSGDDEGVARAFMTTDTVPKFCAARARFGQSWVCVGGQAKGVGMIGPALAPWAPSGGAHATMLAFLTTDAAIEPACLQAMLERVSARSFDSVTVDGDTSTNDTVLLFASGASGVLIEAGSAQAARFEALLSAVCVELCKKIARDGEGATRLIEVRVEGAPDDDQAHRVALSIANSPLVKTAIFGRDPNWGRIAMAAGKAGVAFDPAHLSFSLGGLKMFERGEPVAFDPAAAAAAFERDTLVIALDLGAGTGSWTAWTCDFSYDYVRINAEYHT